MSAQSIKKNNQSIVDRFDNILRVAVEKKSSDIHLKSGLPPVIRVNGLLSYLKEDSDKDATSLMVEDISVLADSMMNPMQTETLKRHQEVDLGYEVEGVGRFRVNICRQRSTPRIVCRYIPEHIKNFKELSLPPIVENLALSPRGLILVTGASGSGKSTTIAAMIDHITRVRACHVVTVEDPIEFSFKDRKSVVTQREVGTDTTDFKMAIKSALRQDPDVILIGEMRDEETIMMALAAAETGHLVLSTLHTLDATETINRILGTVSPAYQTQARLQMSAVLVGVLSQRLLRTKDGHGRVPAIEILLNNRRAQEMIADADRTSEMRTVIEESTGVGMQSFDQSLMDLLSQNIINAEEAMFYCSNPKNFELRLKGIFSSAFKSKEVESISDIHRTFYNQDDSGKFDPKQTGIELEDRSSEDEDGESVPKRPFAEVAKRLKKKIIEPK